MKHVGRNFVRAAQLFVFATALALALPVGAADKTDEKAPDKDIVLRGDAKCTRCHSVEDNPDLFAIGKTRHGTVADGRTPTCTSCHG